MFDVNSYFENTLDICNNCARSFVLKSTYPSPNLIDQCRRDQTPVVSMVETEAATTGVAGLALPVRGIAVPGSGTGVGCVESDAIASDCVFFTGTATHKYSTILTTHVFRLLYFLPHA